MKRLVWLGCAHVLLALAVTACKQEAPAPEATPAAVETPPQVAPAPPEAPAQPEVPAPAPEAISPVAAPPADLPTAASPADVPAASSPTDTGDAAGKLTRITEAFNTGRLDDALADFADDFTQTWPGSPLMAPVRNKADLKQAWTLLRAAFPDGRLATRRLFVDGDTWVAQGVFTGTHKGPFLGVAASGKRVGHEVLHIFKWQDGKLKSARTYGNFAALLAQMGALHMTRPALPAQPLQLDLVLGAGMPANADVLKGVYASFATTDLAGYADRVTPDTVYHDFAEGKEYKGVEDNRSALFGWKQAFPDLKMDRTEFITIGPYVIGESEFRATHKGLLGPIKPTGKRVKMHGADVVRVVDGKIAEGWGYSDPGEVLGQLGLLPGQGVKAKGK